MRDRSSNKDGGFIMIYDLARDLSIYGKKKTSKNNNVSRYALQNNITSSTYNM
jgi:hypothetical protein